MTKLSPIISQVQGYWKVHQYLYCLFNEIKSKNSSRYSIEHVNVRDGEIAVTNGRQIFAIRLPDLDIKNGLHILTNEGYFLPVIVTGKFPNYKDLYLKEDKKTKKVDGEMALNRIIATLFKADFNLDVTMLSRFYGYLSRLHPIGIEVAWNKSDFHFEITGNVRDRYEFTYLQMPMTSIE